MRRAYKSGAAAAAPSASEATSEGYPTEGNVARGVPATIPGPFNYYMLVEAVVTVIEQAGLVPDDDPNQFRDALLAHFATKAALTVALASNAEHTQANPPADKAATPAGVRAVRDALLDAPPGALDTLNELAAALGDDPNFSATIMGLINARLTQDQVDARIDARGRESVLASDIALAAGVRTAQALGASMDGFRWLVIVAGESGSDYGIHARVPRADIVARSAGSEELLGWAANFSNDTVQLYGINRPSGVLTERGAPQSLGLSNSGGVDLAWDGSTLLGWAVDGDSDTAQLYEVNPITGVLTTRGGERNLGSGTWTGNGLVWVSTVTGQIDVGGIELDRAAAASLGIKSSRALHVHEVIGVP